MKIILIASLFILTNATANAQQRSLDPNLNLDSLSDQYLKVGNNFCLVIDAVKDGLIKPDQAYDLEFKSNVLTINGKVASEAYTQKYLKKIEQLNYYRGLPDNELTNFASRNGSPGVYADAPRRYVSGDAMEQMRLKVKYANTLLIDELQAANLIYTRDQVDIRYGIEGIWINDRKLSLKQERKFSPLIEKGLSYTDIVCKMEFPNNFPEKKHVGYLTLSGY